MLKLNKKGRIWHYLFHNIYQFIIRVKSTISNWWFHFDNQFRLDNEDATLSNDQITTDLRVEKRETSTRVFDSKNREKLSALIFAKRPWKQMRDGHE